jgi:hypothetical protein
MVTVAAPQTSRQPPEWLDLKALTEYACVSERTLRNWIHSADNPLPAAQRGNKIFVKRTVFDEWLQSHLIRSGQRIKDIADSVVNELIFSRG